MRVMRMDARLFRYEATPDVKPGWWKPYAIGGGITLALFAAVAGAYLYATGSAWYPVDNAPAQPTKSMAAVLSAGEVTSLEAAVAKNPDDLASRGKLIAYYSAGFHPAELRSHMLWMIRTHPEGITVGAKQYTPLVDASFDPDGYAEGRKLWLARLTRHHVPVAELQNAAAYFKFGDHMIALKLLQRAQLNDDAETNNLGEEYYTHLADGPVWQWLKPMGAGPDHPEIRVKL
ncbi:MAG TPA: hypothetical protein VML19_11245 [Verrucomicrobiae bacterium]|nr:hypothetical protein [Verrucomicrobiae bacterium]